jgi:hypothetical protein
MQCLVTFCIVAQGKDYSLTKKELNMSFTLVMNNKEVKKSTSYVSEEWIKIKHNCRSILKSDKVYCKCTRVSKKSKYHQREIVSHDMRFYIGKDICNISGLKLGDKIEAYQNKKDPCIICFVKSTDGENGHKLSSTNSRMVHTLFLRPPEGFQIKTLDNTELEFDITNDGIIIVNIGKIGTES